MMFRRLPLVMAVLGALSAFAESVKGDYPTGSVVYDGCTFSKTLAEAINVQQVPAQAFEMRFDNCRFAQIGTQK